MSMHVELHRCPTAKDAARLWTAGLPRYDIEPSTCGACNRRVGEVVGSTDAARSWIPLTVVLWDDGIDVLCGKCTLGVDKVLARN